MKKWVFLLLFIVCIVLQTVGYVLSHHNNGSWFVNISSYSLPFLLIANFVCIGWMLLIKKYYWAFGLCLSTFLFLAKPFVETFSLGYLTKPSPAATDSTLNIATFNASTFNNNRVEAFMPDDSIIKTDFFDYLENSKYKPDIICFQEFHHDDADTHRVVDEIVKLTDLSYYYTVPLWQESQHGFFGIMTMSRYPIVAKGTLFVGEQHTLNRGIYTDIVYQSDTIRVINIHLQSMNIRLNKEDSLGITNKFKTVVDSLKAGSIKSKKQIEQVLTAIKTSKYPVMLCGDFNTFPYGYSYQEVKKLLNNSFEKSGKGFGFTLNISPYFVRVDNQFYSDHFLPLESVVIRTIKQSDHYPVFGRYLLKNQ